MPLRKFLFINSTEGFSEEQGPSDELSLGKVTALGVSGVAFDASGQRIVGVATPTAGTDAVNKDYVDGVAAGLDIKASVRVGTTTNLSVTASGSGVGKTLTATSFGAISIDGVSLSLGDRVLVKDQTATADNGIYTVTTVGDGSTAYVLTRATDFDQNPEVTAGSFTFIAEGTVNSDTGWVLTTNDPITVDTTGLAWTQFTGTGSIIAGAGLVKVGSTLDVELHTGAGAQDPGTGGGSSGLEFDVSGAAGKLRAAVNGTGGIERSSSGLAIKIDGTSLATSASGARVLHSPKIQNNFIADEAIAVGEPVAWSGSVNDRLVKGMANTDSKARIVGVAISAASGSGSAFNLVSHGVAPGVISGATVNTPYYLAAAGGLTTTVPGGGNRVIRVGMAKNATDLWVQILDYGKKA